MAMLSPAREWIEINRCFRRMLGYSEEGLIGAAWSDVIHADDAPLVDAQLRRMLHGVINGCLTEGRFVCKDGASSTPASRRNACGNSTGRRIVS